MNLKSFHLVFITLAVILLAGVVGWSVRGDHWTMAVISAAAGVGLIAYERYFMMKTHDIRTP
jgi:uncharacterized membrane protein